MQEIQRAPKPFLHYEKSDHNLVCLTSNYTPIVKQQPVTVQRRWTAGVLWIHRLEWTQWATWRWYQRHDRVCDKLHSFLYRKRSPQGHLRSLSIYKPWISSDLKNLWNMRGKPSGRVTGSIGKKTFRLLTKNFFTEHETNTQVSVQCHW